MKTLILITLASLLMAGCIIEPRPEEVTNDKPLQGTWTSLDGKSGIILDDTYEVLLEKDTVYILYYNAQHDILFSIREYKDTLYIKSDKYTRVN